MKTSGAMLALLASFTIRSYFLVVASEAAVLKQQAQAPWPVYHERRIQRDISTNQTSTNLTKIQNSTMTALPTLKTTTSKRHFISRRRTVRPTGSSMRLNTTGLTEVQREKLKGNRSTVELDHMGFPKLPNSHRRTRPPSSPPLTLNSTGKNTAGTKQTGNFLHQVFANIRDKANGTQNSTLLSSTTESTALSSSKPVPDARKAQKGNKDNKRNFSSAIHEHSVLIAVMSSLVLAVLICLAGYFVQQWRRGKLLISPAVNKADRRSALVVFQAESKQ